jgi:hypothetical protein
MARLNLLAARSEIARNDFTQEIAEKAGIGAFRMKSCLIMLSPGSLE